MQTKQTKEKDKWPFASVRRGGCAGAFEADGNGGEEEQISKVESKCVG